ncbi:MAG: tRNA (uridine(34)/cytosine(34)/5-carboxymethylaminomethyluridine(34)-2'-O)-methyltransferase TrmL [Waddliaceae bacterium]|nr:tRNA (uridine(34)/cytosine(34)/5-carboxymethylaminomethyluridine(34)-2'-O)-methyltransferase TrmL [Waddliaceae bacterium]
MIIGLYEPQIPQNTGNIARTCAVTGSKLILFGQAGFTLEEKKLRRAGLDYWNSVCMGNEESLENYLENTAQPFYFFSSKAKRSFWEQPMEKNSLLIFGSETSGLPQHITDKYEDRLVRIPMLEGQRCLNLSNSVSIAIYEVLRQNCGSKSSYSLNDAN